jgi:MFS transporter, DHA2 family, multidrug resistance protein
VTTALPPGVPPEAIAVARDTLGAAVGIAGQLPGAMGAAVLDVAREAFVQGMQVAAMISVVVAIGVAVFAVVMLRDVRPSASSDPDEREEGERGAGDETSRGTAPRGRVLQPEA